MVNTRNSFTELLWKNPNEDRSEANDRMYGSGGELTGERQRVEFGEFGEFFACIGLTPREARASRISS